ncbi:hypothetical protein MAPG_04107 [Magnaporthiopsis poae ATCC 64411]|uniref:Uncharacterized protein n=1 Tax=Magnaporthiopsis poae (strain ATCC 64411 / 73-15) TaxID=644358 RepID=A0A0C4DVU4_MAGP6|nr:hypothetical protein MAPG_04107 [Magnaporthiopsis poae ATCC 64411]
MSADDQTNNHSHNANNYNHSNFPPTTATGDPNNPNDMSRNRRPSVTSAAFTNLFQRSSSVASGTPTMPGPIATAMDQRRRLSVSTVGLSGTSPSIPTPFSLRRGSLSTNGSDSIDESAIDEDDAGFTSRTTPTTPFTRRMSFGAQAMRNMRPGRGNSPGANEQGFNWSEQLRSRAESTVAAGTRPSFSFGSTGTSPPRAGASAFAASHHDRAKSVSDLPAPPAQAPPARAERPKPDAFQERILKGDFYMD